MKKVKITVLQTTFNADLAKEYGAEGLTACPMMKEGDVFRRSPDRVCPGKVNGTRHI